MHRYDDINQASIAAFEAAINGRGRISESAGNAKSSSAADAFEAALHGHLSSSQVSVQESLDELYEKEYCRKGDWHNGWRSARSRANPPECRLAWEAAMRQTLLNDFLMQMTPL